MGYLVVKKTKINGETKVTTYTETDELEAKRRYHSTLAQAYDEKNRKGLEHLLCMLINDIGGSELKEYYLKSEEPPKKEEATENATDEPIEETPSEV